MLTNFWLLDVNHEVINGEPEVRLWGLDDKNNRILILDRNFLQYLYVLPREKTDPNKVVEEIRKRRSLLSSIANIEVVDRKYFGKTVKVIKVTCRNPDLILNYAKELSKISEVKEILEDDIRYPLRYLINNDMKPCAWHNVEVEEIENKIGVYVDKVYLAKAKPKVIEKAEIPDLRVLSLSMVCYSSKAAPKPERNPVVIISVATNAGETNQFVTKDLDDKPVLEAFIKYVQDFDPDVIVGYGTNRQDWPYLIKRSEKLGVKLQVDRAGTEPHTSMYGHVSITGRANVDFFDFAEDIPEVKVKTLENVADYLGVIKIQKRTLIEDIEIPVYWEDPKKRPELLKYSMENAQSILGVSDVLLDFAVQLANLVGLPLDHVGTAAVGFRVESYLIRQAYKYGELIPTRKEKPYFPFRGAIVLKPKPGIHEKVAVLDFKSVDYNEPIVIMNDNKNLNLIRIGEFIERYANSLKTLKDGCEVAELNGWKVLCFDENFKVRFKPISQVSRHLHSGKLLKITTRTGREIKVTPGHSLFTLNNHLEPIPLKASDINEGSLILIPRRVNLPTEYQNHLCLLKLMEGLAEYQLRDLYLYRKFPNGYWNRIKAVIAILDAIQSGTESIKEIAAVTGHKRRSIYRRIHDLHKHKLIRWDKGKGSIKMTNLGAEFLKREKTLLQFREYIPWRHCNRFRLIDIIDVLKNADNQHLKGWKIGFKRTRKSNLLNVVLSTKALAALLGYYAAQGSTSRSVKKKKAGQRHQYKVRPSFLSAKIHSFLFNTLLNAGKNALKKRVPQEVFLFDESARQSFVEAYLKGKGHLQNDNSDELIQGISLLLMSIRKMGATLLRLAEKNAPQLVTFLRSDLALDYVVKVEEVNSTTRYVYDIGVNSTQNFICGRGWIVAHNSMYPNIMITNNASPDTYVPAGEPDPSCGVYIAPDVKHRFCKEPPGFYKRVLSNLIEVRDEIKEKMKKLNPKSREYRILNARQKAIKVITNACYGYCFDFEEPVLLDHNGHIELKKIGDFVEEILRDKRKLSEYKVFSLNPKTLQLEPCNITHVWRHRSDRDLIEITLEDGASVRMHGEHPFWAFNNGEFVEKRANDLQVGEWIPVLSVIPRKSITSLNSIKTLRKLDHEHHAGILIENMIASESAPYKYEIYHRFPIASYEEEFLNPQAISREFFAERQFPVQFLLNSEVIFRRIKKIEKAKATTKYLYDVKTQYSNFVGGYGLIILHNCGWVGARWYVRQVAEAAAAWGRSAIQDTINMAKREGLEVIYGDTDSIFIKYVPEKTEKFLKIVEDEIGLKIKPDKIYERALFTEAKKRYAGLLPDGRLDIIGLEVARGDWAEAAKKVQRKVLEIILKNRFPQKAVDFVRGFISDLKNRKVPYRDLVIWKTLTKPPEKYAVKAAHVEAAKILIKAGWELVLGDKIGYVIVKGSGKLYQRAKPYMMANYEDLDLNYYIEKQIVPVSLRILTMFGVEKSDLLSTNSKSLSEFVW